MSLWTKNKCTGKKRRAPPQRLAPHFAISQGIYLQICSLSRRYEQCHLVLLLLIYLAKADESQEIVLHSDPEDFRHFLWILHVECAQFVLEMSWLV